MKICYNCRVPLVKDNSSIEHVIPNAIGGKLKSNKLLCAVCNNTLGHEIDVKLAKQLNFFMNFFMIERENGKFQPISGKTKNGEEYILNGSEIKSKPKISVDKNKVSFSGNDEADLKTYFKGLLNKYPQLDLNEILSKADKGRYYLNEPVSINFNIGGDKVFRAITKIAVNFYIYKGGNIDEIDNIIPYIKGKENDKIKRIFHHYGFLHNSLNVDDTKLYHLIKVIGNSDEKVLYSYIELFGTFKFIIKLNSNYTGHSFDNQYFYNLFSKETIEEEILMNYKITEIDNILNNSDNDYFIRSIQNNMQNSMNVAHKIQSKKVVNDLIAESIDKVFGKKENQDKKISKTLLNEFVNDVSYLITAYLSRNSSNNSKTDF